MDGDKNRFAVPPIQVAVLKREAERRAILYPEPNEKDTPDFSACEIDVGAIVESSVGGKRTLIFTVTNKSDVAIPIVGGKLEWQYDPPRSMKAESDPSTMIREVEQLGGSLNLACRNGLNSPVSPGAAIKFHVHDSMAGVLLETLLGDVPDENISFVFGTKSGTTWKVIEDGIPGAVREYAEYIRDGGLDSVCADRVAQEWVEDTFAQEIPTVDLADGTNVIEGTDYVYRSSQTTTWYVPRNSKTASNWTSRLVSMREHFEGMAFVNRPIECTMLQTRVPAYHVNPLPEPIAINNSTMGAGGGLSRDCSELSTRDMIPIFSEYPFRDATGKPICNSAGDAFGWRYGLSRMYFKCSGPNWVGENREYPGPRLEELATECASLLFRLPAPVAESLWKNWPEGFDRRRNSSQYLWFDAVFELAWQGEPGDRLYAERSAPTSTGSIALAGNGLFPRIPKVLAFVSGKVAHEHGHPVQIVSKLNNFVMASIAAIDELLERGGVKADL